MYITNKRAGNQRVKQVRNGMLETGEHIGIRTEKVGIVLKKCVNVNIKRRWIGAKRNVGKAARDSTSPLRPDP